MRVAISGSRGPDPSRGRLTGWTDYDIIAKTVEHLLRAGHIINVGDAPSGVDRMVLMAHETEPFADEFSSDTLRVFAARWLIEGKSAGHNRNEWMISESDMLVAFFAPTLPLTAGTYDAVQCAIKRGIPVHVYWEPVGWGRVADRDAGVVS